jgi:hypothetical protein
MFNFGYSADNTKQRTTTGPLIEHLEQKDTTTEWGKYKLQISSSRDAYLNSTELQARMHTIKLHEQATETSTQNEK